MEFKIVFINHKTSKQITKSNHSYEEVISIFNSGKIILKVNKKVEMFSIVDTVYNVEKKGFAIFLEETELV
ncbi:hypothetical protein ACUH7Y_09540 [Clostridium beijerinckii]|uniref:Uncharacterized protein n=1 Tax=Clostridium beijerinckii TaxID=1520 RepID=A0A7X9SME9_CLOBE|nr:hypothetical protein [Clostridium beijerinckii]NMF04555.1 hypothetical protein [Clostridium beijerinckii]